MTISPSRPWKEAELLGGRNGKIHVKTDNGGYLELYTLKQFEIEVPIESFR